MKTRLNFISFHWQHCEFYFWLLFCCRISRRIWRSTPRSLSRRIVWASPRPPRFEFGFSIFHLCCSCFLFSRFDSVLMTRTNIFLLVFQRTFPHVTLYFLYSNETLVFLRSPRNLWTSAEPWWTTIVATGRQRRRSTWNRRVFAWSSEEVRRPAPLGFHSLYLNVFYFFLFI